ncbi:hypothetical protein J1792_33540 [Streptomyces triculaminicus]|uniref:Conserved hypothetical protein CHP02391 domain-containing protein n=1 Tax=Streptomyces triculaminicus TaxID=2816232 RepID=A0A939JU00_9ACTN|nr:hypothetical protein [Streptomyces triculaminicus]
MGAVRFFAAEPPKPGEPGLRRPGDPTNQTVKAMNEGLRSFAPGVQLAIRNTSAHGAGPMAAQDALEQLGALSLPARWIDDCEDAAA